jgi:hypothetical protein
MISLRKQVPRHCCDLQITFSIQPATLFWYIAAFIAQGTVNMLTDLQIAQNGRNWRTLPQLQSGDEAQERHEARLGSQTIEVRRGQEEGRGGKEERPREEREGHTTSPML